MKLNCLIVAAALWYRSRFRSAVGIQRSEGLRGLIPHFLHFKFRLSNKSLVVVDYVPRKRKASLLDYAGDNPLAFHGRYRVRVFTLSSVHSSDSLFGAYRGALRKR